MFAMYFLPIVDFKTVSAPAPEVPAVFFGDLASRVSENAVMLLVATALAAIILGLLLRTRTGGGPPAVVPRQAVILIDGSNVMHWQDNTPQLAPLLRVVERVKGMGYVPGVVFDANAGWKLFGRYMDDDDLARVLTMPRDQVFVVPKGTQADPYLLATARDHGAQIVTNDRFRDWAETHPEVASPEVLIRGGIREGKVWLQGLDPVSVTSAGPESR